jgi:hypothetical protein
MKMKKIAKIVFLVAFISLLAISIAGPVLALNVGPPPTGVPTSNLVVLINQISSVILLLVGVVAVLFLIIGGFRYITASGVPEQVQAAKGTIMYAVIGVVITLLAYAVVQFVLSQFK